MNAYFAFSLWRHARDQIVIPPEAVSEPLDDIQLHMQAGTADVGVVGADQVHLGLNTMEMQCHVHPPHCVCWTTTLVA